MTWAIPVGLALASIVTFLPALRNGFVWDDFSNLVHNPHVRGLGVAQLGWMVTAFHKGHYIPLTWMSLGLDYLVWGMNPAGYHLTNVLLHAANAVLFYLVALRLLGAATALTGGPWRLAAATAALFFAIHPLRVESVAWVTERRDLLSGLFFLLTVCLYLDAAAAAGSARWRRLGAAILTYGLALASKSMVMTTPALLVLLDVYPLRRLPGDPRRWLEPAARRVWLEKLPFALLSLAAAVAAVHAQQLATNLGPYPWPTRLVGAAWGVWFYVLRTLLPFHLSPLYEVPHPLDPLAPRFLAALIAVAAISGLTITLRRRWPAGLAVWTYQLIAVSPVSGLAVRAGFQLAADRYSYLVCLGWALLVGASAGVLARRYRQGILRPGLIGLAAGAAVLWLSGLGVLAWRQTHVWRDSESLWRHAVTVTPECAICRQNLAGLLMAQGALDPALAHLDLALVSRPDRIAVHGTTRGIVLERMGRWRDALAQYEQVVTARPDDVDARQHLGALLLRLGWAAQAVPHLQRALELRPEAAQARLRLIQAYLALGQAAAARQEYARLRAAAPELAAGIASAFAGE